MHTQPTRIKLQSDKVAYPPHRDKNSALFYELAVYNYTDSDVFMSDSTGVVHAIPARTGYTTTARYLKIVLRATFMTDRAFDRQNVEIPDPNGTEVYKYEVSQYDLRRSAGAFLTQLALLFAATEVKAKNNHPYTKDAFEARVRTTVAAELDAYHAAPLMCIANDPTGRVKKLHFAIGDAMYCADVRNDMERASTCDLRILGDHGAYDVVSFNMNDVAKSIQTLVYQDLELIASADIMEIRSYLHEKKLSPDQTITKSMHERLLKQGLNDLQTECSQLKVKLQDAEFKLASAQNTCKTLNERIMMIEQADDLARKRSDDRQSAEIKQQTEEIKLTKERVSAASADIGAAGSIIKTAAVAVPAMVGFALWTKSTAQAAGLVASAGVGLPAVATVAIGVAVAGVVTTCGKDIWDGVCSAGRSIWNGICSLFS